MFGRIPVGATVCSGIFCLVGGLSIGVVQAIVVHEDILIQDPDGQLVVEGAASVQVTPTGAGFSRGGDS